ASVRTPAERLKQKRVPRCACVVHRGTGERPGDLREAHQRLEGARSVVAVSQIVSVGGAVSAGVDSRAARALTEASRPGSDPYGEGRLARGLHIKISVRRTGVESTVRCLQERRKIIQSTR